MSDQKARYRIRRTFHRDDAEGETLYELSAVNYKGPWMLPKGAILEVTFTPKKEKEA